MKDSVINNSFFEVFNSNPILAVILSVFAGFLAEYEPIIRFAFYSIAGLISVFTLLNKMWDFYIRIKKNQRRRKSK